MGFTQHLGEAQCVRLQFLNKKILQQASGVNIRGLLASLCKSITPMMFIVAPHQSEDLGP